MIEFEKLNNSDIEKYKKIQKILCEAYIADVERRGIYNIAVMSKGVYKNVGSEYSAVDLLHFLLDFFDVPKDANNYDADYYE